MKLFKLIPLFIFVAAFSCKFYKRDILFKADKEKEIEFHEASKSIQTPGNYLINKNDEIEFLVLTNKGEIIIDPTSEFAKQIAGVSGAGKTNGGFKYLIDHQGFATLPILGRVKLDSLTTLQCDSILSKLYSKYYLDPFVKSHVINKRVYVLGSGAGGSIGGGGNMGSGNGRVIELKHENITLMELLSEMGGPQSFSFVNRVKIIRGDLKNPKIFSIDLTRWDSFQSSNLVLQPNDIIYIEPGRRKALDFLRDFALIGQLATFVLTFYLVFKL